MERKRALSQKVFLFMILCTFANPGHPSRAFADTVEALYLQARSDYKTMLSLPQQDWSPESWQKCIQQFRRVLKEDKRGEFADRCLYLIAQSYHHLHDAYGREDDLKSAKEHYRMLIHKYPESPLADDAQYLLGILCMEQDPDQAYLEFVKVGVFFPEGDMQAKAAQKATEMRERLKCGPGPKTPSGQKAEDSAPAFAAASGPSPASSSPPTAVEPSGPPAKCPIVNHLENVQYWSGADYTRVVLYVSAPVNFKQHNLPAEPKVGLPDRIFLDLQDCLAHPKVKTKISIRDKFLQGVRVAQYDATRVRVVLDIESMDTYKIFSLADPYRVIIDVRGKEKKPEPVVIEKPKPKDGKKTPLPSLARQLGLEVRRIVIDPGHGGKDKGAISPNNVYEKDVVLSLAKRIKRELEKRAGCEVILTRTQDRFLSLEERTAIANAEKADLFISIHTNAHQDRSLGGIETYFLNLSKDVESARVAALENATSTKKISDLESILHDLMMNTKINESARLATEVHHHVVNAVKSGYGQVRDLGVKQAPFYVLLGAEMPSILIETAFLTNEQEEKRLKDGAFQQNMAKGITTGVISYMHQMKQVAQMGDAS